MNRCFATLMLATAFAGCSLHAQDLRGIIGEAKQSYDEVADYLFKSAEQMPEENYTFRPTRDSQTFGQLLDDAAWAQADLCSAVTGNRVQRERPLGRSKADVLQALKQAVRACDSAYAAVNALNANQEMWFGSRRHSKLGLLFLNSTRENEFYGRGAVYLRLKGFLPPSEQARLVPVN